MIKLPRVSGDKAVRTLQRLGFRKIRQRGSHVYELYELTDDEINIVEEAAAR